MKKNWALRVLCVALCAIMLTATPLSALGATYISDSKAYPVILVNNMSDNDLYMSPNTGYQEKVYPPDINSDMKFVQYLTTYIAGIAQGEYAETTLAIFPEVMEWFEGIRCNLDGTSMSMGIGPVSMNGYPMSEYIRNDELVDLIAGELGKMLAEEFGAEKVYVFNYDWRLDPISYAAQLKELIAKVKADTGYDKVKIVSNGMGANIVSVYLNKYATANNFADIDAYIPINSTANGVTLIGDLFSGEIDIDPNGLVRYVNDLPNNIITGAIFWLVQYILNGEWVHYEAALKIDLYLIHQKKNIYDTYIRDLINTMPGLWALVPYETFDEAMALMYPANYPQINASLKNTLESYHAIQKQAPDTLFDASKAGVKVSVVSSYGLQALPLTEYATVETGDGVVDTRYSSYGAYTSFLNNDWVGKGLYGQIVDDGHRHTNKHKYTSTAATSSAGSVDASTCVLPEHTWFIYGLKRNAWSAESDSQYYFLAWLLSATDKAHTVHDNAYYPQFMEANRFKHPAAEIYGSSSNENNRFYTKGDTNVDGNVKTNDARLALRHAVQIQELKRAGFKNGDLNNDGKITTFEARKILRVAVKIDDAKSLKTYEEPA